MNIHHLSFCGSAAPSAQGLPQAAAKGQLGGRHLKAQLGKHPPPELPREAVGGCHILSGCRLQTSVPCYKALSTELVTTGQLAFPGTRALRKRQSG